MKLKASILNALKVSLVLMTTLMNLPAIALDSDVDSSDQTEIIDESQGSDHQDADNS